MKKRKSAVQEPVLPVYDQSHFLKISPRLLIQDFLITGFVFFLFNDFLHLRNQLVEIKPLAMLSLFAGVMVFLPWYLGFIYQRYAAAYRGIPLQIIKWVFIGITVICVIFLMYLGPGRMKFPENDFFTENIVFMVMFLSVLGPLTGLAGMASGMESVMNEINKTSQKDEDDADLNPVTMTFLMIYFAVGFLVFLSIAYFKTKLGNSIFGVIIYFGVFIGSCALGIVPVLILMMIKRFLVFIKVYRYLTAIRDWLFPGFTAFMLLLWNTIGEIQLNTLSHATGDQPGLKVLYLFLTGFIPFRIIEIFRPPLHLLHMIIGTLTTVFYIAAVIRGFAG